MAKIGCRPFIQATVTLELNEPEAAALDALVGYGADEFLKVFYEKLGQSYLRPFEGGLRSLFDSVRNGEGSVAHFLHKAREARAVFEDRKIAADKPQKETARI